MRQLGRLAHQLRKLARQLNDVETLATGDPDREARRFANQQIYRTVQNVTRKLYLRGPRKRRDRR